MKTLTLYSPTGVQLSRHHFADSAKVSYTTKGQGLVQVIVHLEKDRIILEVDDDEERVPEYRRAYMTAVVGSFTVLRTDEDATVCLEGV